MCNTCTAQFALVCSQIYVVRVRWIVFMFDLQGALGMPRSFQRGGYKGTGHLAVFDKQQNPPGSGSKVKAAMTREFNTGGHAVKVPRRVAMFFFLCSKWGSPATMRWITGGDPPARVKSVKPQQRPERSELLYSFFSTSFGLVSSWSRRIQMRWEMMWRRIRSEFLRILMTWVFFGFARLIGTQGQSWARGGKRQWWWCCCKLKPH